MITLSNVYMGQAEQNDVILWVIVVCLFSICLSVHVFKVGQTVSKFPLCPLLTTLSATHMVVSVDGAGVAVLPPGAGVGGEGVAGVAGVGQQVLRVLQQRPQLRVQHVEPEMQ